MVYRLLSLSTLIMLIWLGACAQTTPLASNAIVQEISVYTTSSTSTTVPPTATATPTSIFTETPTSTPLPPPTTTPFIEIKNETAVQYLTSVLIGQPGQIVTHTFVITNMSSADQSYYVSIRMETRREFALLGGWQYDLDRDRYDNSYLYIDSKKSREVNIPVGIPNRATSGMVNKLFVGTPNLPGYGPSEPQFTTVVSVPTSIKQVSQVDISAQDVSVRDSYAFVATGPDGLHVLDITDPTKPTEIADYSQQGATWHVASAGSYIYTILVNNCDAPHTNDWSFCRNSNLYILDVSNPAKPVEVGLYNLPDYTYSNEGFEHRERSFHKLKIFGNYAYVKASQELYILDISDPTKIHRVNPPNMQIEDFFVTDKYLYVVPFNSYNFDDGAKTSYLKILDQSSLGEIGSYHLPNSSPAIEVTVINHIAYVRTMIPCIDGCESYYYSWFLFDVSNPTNPVEISHTETNYLKLNAFDPTESTKFYKPFEIQDIAFINGYAYLADGQAGLRVLDISSPEQPPVEVDAFGAGAPRYALNVEVSSGYIYLANGEGGGLSILQYTAP